MPAQVTSTGRLQAAPLQFALGSQLLLDETVLTGGKLAATGIHNFQVLPEPNGISKVRLAVLWHICKAGFLCAELESV